MCVNFCHRCFHGAKGVVVNPPSCHLVDFGNLTCDRSRHFSTGQLFQSALELFHRILMWSAFPFIRFAVHVEAEAKIFQLRWSRDMGLGRVYL